MDYPANVPAVADVLTIPVRTDIDVLDRISMIIDAETASLPRLWLFFLDRDGMQSNVVVPIDNIPEFPDPRLVSNVCYIASQVMSDDAPGASAVITLSRPGPAVLRTLDRYWLRAFQRGAARHRSAIRMFCLATPDGVRKIGRVSRRLT